MASAVSLNKIFDLLKHSSKYLGQSLQYFICFDLEFLKESGDVKKDSLLIYWPIDLSTAPFSFSTLNLSWLQDVS